MERTLSIIKPDRIGYNLLGKVIRRSGQHGLKVAALRMVKLSKDDVGVFHIVQGEGSFPGRLPLS